MQLKWVMKGLSPEGRAKLNNIKREVAAATRKTMLRYMRQVIKPAIISRAPSAQEEAIELSRGDSGRGTWKDRRFYKGVGQRYVRDALALEPITTSSQTLGAGFAMKGIIWVNYGRSLVINSQIGFSWDVDLSKRGGKSQTVRRSTLDAAAHWGTWLHLIKMWEDGGTFTAKPRGNYKLGVDAGAKMTELKKTIPAKHMFKKGYTSNRAGMKMAVTNAIRSASRRATR